MIGTNIAADKPHICKHTQKGLDNNTRTTWHFERPTLASNTLHIIQLRDLKLTKLLGSGGFGCVYLAYFGDLKVAVKKMHCNRNNDYVNEESFRAELNISTVKHPNIVQIIGCSANDQPERPFIVMEYAGDRNLQQMVNDALVILDVDRRLRYGIEIGNALTFIHSQHILHLDVKPPNIMLTCQDTCKLGDFGCCQVMEEDTGMVSPSPRSYMTGTFAYRAPELLQGEAPTTKADIYSLGITLWQLVSRECPYAGQNQHVVIFGVVAYNLRPHIPGCADMPHPVEQCYQDLYTQCWHTEPHNRPTALDVAETLLLWKSHL